MNINKLDLNLLIIFDTIYETQSISHAADQLDMNQPTISNALARLRKQMDDPLFVRNGGKMMPTARAREIVTPVRRALAAINSIEIKSGIYDPLNDKREFRIHMVSTIEMALLEHLSPIIENGDGATFELLPLHFMSNEIAVSTNAADLAIGIAPITNPELNWEELCDMPLVVMTRKGNPKIKHPLSLEDIFSLGSVAFNTNPTFNAPGSKAITEKIVLKTQYALNAIYKVNNELEMAAIVSVTDLIAVVPVIFAKSLPKELNLEFHTSPMPKVMHPLCMIWRKSNNDDPGLIWLRKEIQLCVEKTQQRKIHIIDETG